MIRDIVNENQNCTEFSGNSSELLSRGFSTSSGGFFLCTCTELSINWGKYHPKRTSYEMRPMSIIINYLLPLTKLRVWVCLKYGLCL